MCMLYVCIFVCKEIEWREGGEESKSRGGWRKKERERKRVSESERQIDRLREGERWEAE